MNIKELYSIYINHPIISTDTRRIEKNSLFFCLKGNNFDGNKFAEQAIKDGAIITVIDNPIFKKNEKYILVKNVLKTLQELAKHHREQLKIPIIGITGSNGKTTTKELMKSVLSQKLNCFATKGNLNNHIGVPLSILSIKKTHEIAVIEMGANHQKEIEFLCEIAKPDFGLITNIGKAHLEGFGGFEGVKKGKKELYKYLIKNNKKALINADDDILNKYVNKIESFTYGYEMSSNCNGKIIKHQPSLKISYKYNSKEYSINSNLIGTYNFNNILAAISTGIYFDLNEKQIKAGIENYIPTNNRSQLINTKENKIILDAYNANPTSMKLALENLNDTNENNKIAILGDMLELGDESKKEHSAIINILNKLKLKAFLVGNEFGEIKQNNYLHFKNTNQLNQYLVKNNLTNHLILIKGSRGIKLEKTIDIIT